MTFVHRLLSILLLVSLFAGAVPSALAADSGEVSVGFDETERELLKLLSIDIPKIMKISPRVLVFHVNTKGFTGTRDEILKSRVEEVMSSGGGTVVFCEKCLESFAGFAESPDAEEKLRALGARQKVSHGISVSEIYHPSELQLTVRLIDLNTGAIAWIRTYSSRELYQGSFSENSKEPLSSVNSVLMGEVAFRTVLSSGFISLPPLEGVPDGGGSAQRPYFGVLIGERYDGGRKEFGFGMGVSFKMQESAVSTGEVPELPALIHIGPQFRYVYNSEKVNEMKWVLQGELGAMFSTTMSTGYIGFGPELMMVRRFSIGIIPMWIAPTEVKSKLAGIPGMGTAAEGKATFGGFATLIRGNILW